MSLSTVADFADNPFHGLISTLRSETGGNPIDTGAVLVSAPTQSHEEYPLRNLFEYDDQLEKCYWNFAHYNPEPHENWIQFEFVHRSVILSGYSLRSGGSSHPKSWSIQGSNDGVEWKVIHEVGDCALLDAPRKTATFQIENSDNAPFRLIRYVRSANLSADPLRHYRINLKAIEFFGSVHDVAD
jgi:hypothetical protein